MSDYISAALFNDTTRDGHFGCDLVVETLERNLAAQKINICFRHSVEDDWRTYDQIKSTALKPDIVIVNGEGTIHHPATWERAAILSEVGPYAKNVLKVPAFLINATVHELDQKTSNNLRCFDKIFVRDTQSQSELLSFGIDSTVTADLTMAANIRMQANDESRVGICGTDSVFPEVAQNIRELSRKNRWVYAPISRFWNPEMNILKGPQDYVDILSSHSLVVTGRYHVVTICLLTKTPFVAVDSNTPKISSLLSDVFASNFRAIKKDQILSLDLEAYAKWSPRELDALLKYRERAKDSVARMFSEIRNYANEKMTQLS